MVEAIMARTVMHPMGRFIYELKKGEASNTFYEAEEKNLLALFLIFLEITKGISYSIPFLYEDAIKDLTDLMEKVNNFNDVQQLLVMNNVTDSNLIRIWATDGFFIISEDAVFKEQELTRKNVCLMTLKKVIAEAASK